MSDQNLPPPPPPKFSFGLQALAGVITVGVLTALFFSSNAGEESLPLIVLVPVIGLILCVIPRTRGLGCGLLLGLGLSALILFGLCVSGLQGING